MIAIISIIQIPAMLPISPITNPIDNHRYIPSPTPPNAMRRSITASPDTTARTENNIQNGTGPIKDRDATYQIVRHPRRKACTIPPLSEVKAAGTHVASNRITAHFNGHSVKTLIQ